jgi:integrase
MSIADARKAAKAYDPQKEQAKEDAGSFKDVAEDFVKRHVDRKGLRSKREIERQLRVYVYPRWKDRALFDISRKDVNKLLDDITDNHGPRQADAVLATVRKLMAWYEVRDDNFRSPIVRGMKRADYKPRDRWLSDAEIRGVWEACAACDSSGVPLLDPSYSAAVRLMLLTGQRREKIATMKWSDIDDDGVWTIQREAREKGAPDTLTLSQIARQIIATVPKIDGNNFVFAGRGKKAFNAWSQRKGELDKLLPDEMPAWGHHDLRRTCRKLMTRRHIETEIAERALGHSIKGIQAVYDDPESMAPASIRPSKPSRRKSRCSCTAPATARSPASAHVVSVASGGSRRDCCGERVADHSPVWPACTPLQSGRGNWHLSDLMP